MINRIAFIIFPFLICYSLSNDFVFNIPKEITSMTINTTNDFIYEASWSKQKGVEAKFFISHSGTNVIVIHEKEKQGFILTNGRELQTVKFVMKVISTNIGEMYLPRINFSFIATNEVLNDLEAFNTNFVFSSILIKEKKTSIIDYLIITAIVLFALIIFSYTGWQIINKVKSHKKRRWAKKNDILWSSFAQEIKSENYFRFQPNKKEYLLFLLEKCEGFNEKAEKLKCSAIPEEIIFSLKNLADEIKFSPTDDDSSKVDFQIVEFNKYVEKRKQKN